MTKLQYQIIELKRQGKSYKEIALALNASKDYVRECCYKYKNEPTVQITRQTKTNNNDIHVINYIGKNYSGYEYLGGYSGSDGYLYLMCKACGNCFKVSSQILRPSRNTHIVCHNCVEVKRQIDQQNKAYKSSEKIKFKEQENEMRKLLKANNSAKQLSFKICKRCGNIFVSDKENKYCSALCRRRANDSQKEHIRRIRCNNKQHDVINLYELSQRDNMICHICGGSCDYSDYVKSDGVFIAGDNYPSIDHYIPLSKGGTHTWDNVRLAHRKCNTIKSDRYPGVGKIV